MSALTLPGTIPGLLRRCSPVICHPHGTPAVDAGRAVVASITPEYAIIAYDDTEDDAGPTWVEAPLDLSLDLTDATGRAHAAWWLATKSALLEPMSAQVSRWSGGRLELLTRHPGGQWPGGQPPAAKVRAVSVGDLPNFIKCAPPRIADSWSVCPSLANLDPNDPRLLGDGSRHVDAEALRLVVLHVAGLTTKAKETP